MFLKEFETVILKKKYQQTTKNTQHEKSLKDKLKRYFSFFRCSGLGPGLYRRPNEAGLVLLSKEQMTDQQYTDLHPSTRELLVKAYLQAMVGF